MTKTKAVKATKAELRRKVFELETQIASRCKAALREIPQFESNVFGSGVILQLTVLGGRALPPVCIRDGLSRESVIALSADIERSYGIATLGDAPKAPPTVEKLNSTSLAIGDVVERMDGALLRSGAETFTTAIVVQIEPLVLVSEDVSMRWEATIKGSLFRPLFTSSPRKLAACMKRLNA
jgi:hypothetical protein